MATITQQLLNLFGWKTVSPPRDKFRKGDDPELGGQYGQNPYQLYANSVKPPYERRRKYDIYDELDELPELSSVLDAYAEDAAQFDREKKAIVWIAAEQSEVQKELESLFKRLDMQTYMTAILRDLGKYGDDFALLDIDPITQEIQSWDWMDPRDVERVENNQGVLVGFERTELLPEVMESFDKNERPTYTFKPWDIVHFRLYKRKREFRQKFRNIYGTSILSGAERIGKQVKIMDDMLMVRRLTKTLDKTIYKIDTGRAAVEEELLILKRWRNALKRRPYIDPASKSFDSMFDPFTWQEDIFWPQRADSVSSVDVIPGQGNVADIVDIEHFRDKLFGALRAPKAYFGFEGDINAKATLSIQDIKWGRAVNQLQNAAKNGLKRLCQIQLALKGMDPESKFDVGMVVPSVLEELSRLEAMQTFIDVAERMAALGENLKLDKSAWKMHILRAVIGMTDDEIDKFATEPVVDVAVSDPTEIPIGSSGDDAAQEPEKEGVSLEEVIGRVLKNRMKTDTSEVHQKINPAEFPPKIAPKEEPKE